MKNIIVAGVVIGLVVYSLILYNKNMQLSRDIDTIIEVASQELDTQSSIDECVSNAYAVYVRDWNTACSSLGQGTNCLLPAYKSDRIDQMYKDAQEMCVTRYK